ncbi:MAG: DMT family transporter [Actinomycetales bacterium]|nr:DMT family transporter [Actinomycetales bacterium]
MHRPDAIGVLMYLLAAFLFGLNGALAKLALEAGLDVTRLTELRNAGAMVLLMATVLIRNRAAFRVQRGEWPLLLAYGVISFVLVQFLYFFTISRLPLGIGTLLAFLAPVVVVLWVRFGRRQPVGAGLWIGILLTLAGLALVAEVWRGLTLDLVGLLSGLGVAISLALYWLLGEAGQRRRDPVSLSMWAFILATATWSVIAPWWSFPWDSLVATTAPSASGFPSLPVWAVMAWVIVLGTVVPFLLVLGSLRRIGAQRAGVVATTEPLWAGAIAIVVLGETVSVVQAIGAVIVVAGIIAAETSRQPAPAVSRAGSDASGR